MWSPGESFPSGYAEGHDSPVWASHEFLLRNNFKIKKSKLKIKKQRYKLIVTLTRRE